ncbi:MAG TPA: VWA domain-containing protein [Pyrinomonadaceae bacterium]|nr:VWA domain-containing protein [Pyrinomonadaceae bacterium]
MLQVFDIVNGREKRGRSFSWMRAGAVIIVIGCMLGALWAQAGRRAHPTGEGSSTLNVVAMRSDESANPITAKDISLFDNGVEQTIKSFMPDRSAARIVLLVDNSLTFRADVEKLESAVLEFAYEIYDGDKLLIVGYDDNAEIVSDWTDESKKLQTELKAFRKKGNPHLFDAMMAVAEDALRPLTSQKRAIVVISDGLDRGSKAKFEAALSVLQALDVTVYCVQAPDRTRGAIRRDVPKPRQVIDDLAEGTGGRIFPIDDPGAAAKAICDELRKNRYILSYLPKSVVYAEARRLLVVAEKGIDVRAKTMQPPAN